ncbi:MAG: hypothetical protein U0183_24525 [Polyangiaceae bacterium]
MTRRSPLAAALVATLAACSTTGTPPPETSPTPTSTALPTTSPTGTTPPPADGGPAPDGAAPPTDGGVSGNVVGLGGIAAWNALSAAEKAKVTTTPSLFLHQSVGQDLEDGVETLGLSYRTYRAPVGAGLNGQIFRSFGVDNGNPTQKTARWQSESTRTENAQLAVTLMKYGYADVTPALLATAKTAYMSAVTAIKAAGKKVVHVTPPLVFDTAENPAKIQFREWMLQTFPGDVIYDLQDVESTHPTTGARCEVGGVWRICQEIRSTRACLSPQSGPQGDDDSQGHICPVQGTRIAPSFLYALYLAVR